MATLVTRKLYKSGNSYHVTIPKAYCQEFADDEGNVPIFLLTVEDKHKLLELTKNARR